MPPRRLLLAVLVAAIVLGGTLASGRVGLSADREGAKVSPEKIQRSIEKARDWLLREQEPNGSWQVAMRADDTRVGATAPHRKIGFVERLKLMGRIRAALENGGFGRFAAAFLAGPEGQVTATGSPEDPRV